MSSFLAFCKILILYIYLLVLMGLLSVSVCVRILSVYFCLNAADMAMKIYAHRQSAACDL